MRICLVPLAAILAEAEDISTTADSTTNPEFSADATSLHATELRDQLTNASDPANPEGREILPIREYVSQQFLKALQGRGLDDWVLSLERALASTVATTQNTLWRNELVESLSRQREQIRRRVDNVPNEQVPSILSTMQKRSKNAWNGRIDETTGQRLPSFADIIADTWVDSVGDTLNLPILGPFNPALWKPEEVAEVLGPLFNMIPHETAKLLQHKDMSESDSANLEKTSDTAAGWSEFLDFLSGSEFDSEPAPTQSDRPAISEGTKADQPIMEAEIPGFGHLMMNDEWQTYKVNPVILDLPILGALNPAQQLAANLPPVYLPYKAQRLRDHGPEWLTLEGLNAMMPINAYTPKENGNTRERRPAPLYSILRGVNKTALRRRLEAELPKTWTQTITESKLFRSILHYLPKFGKEEVETATAVDLPVDQSTRALASHSLVSAATDTPRSAGSEDLMLEGKRYYHNLVDAVDQLPAAESRQFDI